MGLANYFDYLDALATEVGANILGGLKGKGRRTVSWL